LIAVKTGFEFLRFFNKRCNRCVALHHQLLTMNTDDDTGYFNSVESLIRFTIYNTSPPGKSI